MATGGRVLHHMAAALPDPRNTVLFVGYQAAGTRGRQLVDGAREVRIHGQSIPVNARIAKIDSMSAHADRGEILRWLGTFPAEPSVCASCTASPSRWTRSRRSCSNGSAGRPRPRTIFNGFRSNSMNDTRRYLLESVDDAAVVQLYADGFSALDLRDKILVWHLYLAAIAGRDIYYDQRYAHNLEMRALLEAMLTHGSVRRPARARGDSPLHEAVLDQHRPLQQPDGAKVHPASDAR